MRSSNWIIGPEISLPVMLKGREDRVRRQKRAQIKRPSTLVCFTLNIAGPIKRFPLAEEVFYNTFDLIRNTLLVHRMPPADSFVADNVYGMEGYLSVHADPYEVKKVLLELEENEPAGRLFDIDVLKPDGEKVSRSELGLGTRPCLVCGKTDGVCARSRAHSVEELQDATVSLLLEQCGKYRLSSEMIGRLCRQAMLMEVYTTPKPGLVDLNNSGSHTDMDVSLFEKSTFALEPYFARFAAAGFELQNESAEKILSCIRPIGLEAENAMYQATGGVNTHKGMIFSLGILAAATGYVIASYSVRETLLSQILRTAGMIASPAFKEDFRLLPLEDGHVQTAGEEQYEKLKLGGIRAEAAGGFLSVQRFCWPYLAEYLDRDMDYKRAGSLALMHLLANVDDSNMIKRSSREEQLKVKEELHRLLETDPEPAEEKIIETDNAFISRNLSAGGCADLLALTFWLYLISWLL